MAYMEELAKALKDDDPLTRERVANALKELEDPRATLLLIEALGDPCGDVRRAAAWALSWVGDKRAQPALIRALDDGNDSVRLWAASGLRRVGDESAVEALIEALSDPYDIMREQAVLALAEIGDRRAIDPLIKALADENTNVRMVTDQCLRETFKIKYNSETRQSEDIAVNDEYDLKNLPPKEREKINRQLQTVLSKIEEMEYFSSPVRDDKLYDMLYDDHGLGRKQVARLTAILMRNGSVYSPKPGYYTNA